MATEDWKTQPFRAKVIAQIEDSFRQSSTPMSKSAHEMENHVFQKAQSREQYLALVARLILHVREFNAQKEKKPGGMGADPMMGIPQGQAQAQAPLQDPMNALQNLAMQGSSGMGGPQQGMQPHHLQQMQMMQQQQQQQQQQAGGRGPAPRYPLQIRHQTQQGPPPPHPALQRQDAFLVTSPPQIQSIQSMPLPASSTGMQRHPHQPPMQGGQQQYVQAPVQPPASHPPVSSPAQHGSPMLTAPSPQGVLQQQGVKGPMAGAPSPSGSINTPGNIQNVKSPGNVSAEEQVYLEKLNQLSKYIEPLRRIINNMERDEDRMKDTGQLEKMKALLDVLLNSSSKRLTMMTLLKCEQLLNDFVGSKPSSSVSSTTHICQPLINAVAENIQQPNINHTLQKTFGPAISALWGAPITAPSIPRKRKHEEDRDPHELSDLLQGEIARLDYKFRISLDHKFHKQSDTVHLVCNINDKHLPSVPPILIKVPDDYPKISPECDTRLKDYESTDFLKCVQSSLQTSLSKMPNRFSLSSLLDTWEMSIRKACAPLVTIR